MITRIIVGETAFALQKNVHANAQLASKTVNVQMSNVTVQEIANRHSEMIQI